LKYFSKLVLILCCLSNNGAYSLVVSDSFTSANNHKYLVENADYIVRGTVDIIQYEQVPRVGLDDFPTTLVTVKVLASYYGEVKSQEYIRLRFVGGSTDDGRHYVIPSIPKFMAGDDLLLFIKGNGTSPCPLVRCAMGHVRIRNNLLYTTALNDERQVALYQDGTTLTDTIDTNLITTIADYSNKLHEIINNSIFQMNKVSTSSRDALTVKFVPPGG
jgi:hypothetical protein